MGATAADIDIAAPLRILLVDDHQIVVDGLRAMLGNHADRVTVMGACSTEREVLAVLDDDLRPDVITMDVRLGAQSGLDICAAVRRHDPAACVVFLTVYDDEQYLFQALRAGASGYLLKRVGGVELVEHLERAHSGAVVIDPTIAGRVALAASRLQSGTYWPGSHLGLTQRESEVLRLVAAGLSNRAIAQRLFLGDETVKSHLRAIYRKLDVADRSQAVAVALREGVAH